MHSHITVKIPQDHLELKRLWLHPLPPQQSLTPWALGRLGAIGGQGYDLWPYTRHLFWTWGTQLLPRPPSWAGTSHISRLCARSCVCTSGGNTPTSSFRWTPKAWASLTQETLSRDGPNIVPFWFFHVWKWPRSSVSSRLKAAGNT